MAPISKEIDYLVIGSGSGGLAAARKASSAYGVKAMIVESKDYIGGTCVNVGCVPKKVMWHAADIFEMSEKAKHYGIDLSINGFDWGLLKKNRDAYIERLHGIYKSNLEKDKIEYVEGTASIRSPTEVDIKVKDGSTHTVKAKHICIATGGKPNIPDIPGSEYGISSDGFFALDKQPKHAVVVGAGYIAVELAGVFHATGTETHLYIRHDTFLRNFDPMCSETLLGIYKDRGINIHPNAPTFKKVEKLDNGRLKITNPDDSTIETDVLLWAIGRSPDVKELNLEKVGIATTDKGHIKVDDYQNTNISNIYALGDVCGKAELTPVAIAAGRKLADRVFGAQATSHLDYGYIPSVVFSHPEIGTIGLTEPQAKEKYGEKNLKIYNTQFTSMIYMVTPKRQPTKYKLICTGPEEKIVGLHMIGEASSEILQGFGVAIKMGATKKDFDSCVAIHPTSAEELVTLK